MGYNRKRYHRYAWFTGSVLVGVAGFILWFAYQQIRQRWVGQNNNMESNFKMYPGFGIPLPEGYVIHGIDVSRYQHQINWPLVKQMKSGDVRIGFAFVKATEGERLIDRQFARNWRRCRELGIIRGAYHFYRPEVDAATQARLFIRTVHLLPGDLPPVLDVEINPTVPLADFQREVQLWLTLVEQHYRIKPIIYTNASYYTQFLHPRFADYPLWVAHYRERRQPRIPRNWTFWQHNESGRVNGINAFVDFNVFYGDSLAFKRLLKGSN